jgi:RNA polymerase sigma-70 factor (ECF subfamily)
MVMNGILTAEASAPSGSRAASSIAEEGIGKPPEQLWSQEAPRLLRAAIALGVPPEEAADLVQETLLAAFRNLHRYRSGRGSFEVWTHTILVRRCSNWRRARARFARALLALGDRHPETSRPPDAVVDARRRLERLLASLTPVRRRVWILREISGFSHGEIAAILRMREPTVRSHLRHAHQALHRAAEIE